MCADLMIKPRQKLTNRQIKAQDTKEKIYNAALGVIQQKGYGNVSIGDITEAAGVSKGSFYTHFDSKESLLRFTYDQLNPIYIRAYNQVKDLDFLEALCSFIKISFAELEKLGKEIMKALIVNYFSNEFKSVYLDQDRQIYKCMDMIVSTGKVQGVVGSDVPTKEYVRNLFSVLMGSEELWCMMPDDAGALSDFASRNIRLTAMGIMAECNNQR